jgi:riboflavin biosynthesis pyrimidine reductase
MTAQDTPTPRTAERWRQRFADLEARRTARSVAPLSRVRTIVDHAEAFDVRAVGNDWSRAAFDGPFYESRRAGGVSIGVVFVRSREGNTGTRNPAALGGGAVDEHLIYEGLTRAAADAVLVGAGTLHPDAIFTVWRPELIALRLASGLPRHPAQVVLSADGTVRPDDVLLFNVPQIPVTIVTSARGRDRLAPALESRPWVTAIAGRALQEQFEALGAAGIRRGCSVGGRRSATALVDAGLVQDVYLTTTEVSGGEPATPWYTGTRELNMGTVVVKEWEGPHGIVRFEHGVI